MPSFDVSDILLDPEWMTTNLVCVRSTETVGANGIGVETIKNTTFAGVVTSDQGDVLSRLEGSSRTAGNVLIHTRFVLRESHEGNAADMVIWNGVKYTVSKVNDYSSYGRGFVAATCDLLPMSD
jgi:hypothetical protein